MEDMLDCRVIENQRFAATLFFDTHGTAVMAGKHQSDIMYSLVNTSEQWNICTHFYNV